MITERDHSTYVHWQTYDQLHATSLTPKQHERTCNYWFTVTTSWTAHTAFRARGHLDQWLRDRGLDLEGDLPDDQTCKSVRIRGTYRTAMHMSRSTFPHEAGAIKDIRQMSNGQYTLGRITEEDGVRTVHYLNPNVKDRPVYDYQESRALVG